jgi:DNA modification methylase
MLQTEHRVIFSHAQHLDMLQPGTIQLVVTSPPYPMIEMWDGLFKEQSEDIRNGFRGEEPHRIFELMHGELDKVWSEIYRILEDGGIACINIGDATRTLRDRFYLFSNHARVITGCERIGFSSLPLILWRKETNSPTKFMGSGMLPPGGYVTLEHEYILIFRKGKRRGFEKVSEKDTRARSAFFWEERNRWFSDVWDFKGTRQLLEHRTSRERSAAYPFELAYRLINMYSLKGDRVLDPFLGTGTTIFAAMASCRHSVGVEVDHRFKDLIYSRLGTLKRDLNGIIAGRLEKHLKFIRDSHKNGRELKHRNVHYGFPVMTRQESETLLQFIRDIRVTDRGVIQVRYSEKPTISPP